MSPDHPSALHQIPAAQAGPPPANVRNPSPLATYLTGLLFVVCLAGPWLWFHLGSRWLASPTQDSSPGLMIGIKTNLAGLRFEREFMDPQVMLALGTTDVVQGVYFPSPSGTNGSGREAWPAGSTGDPAGQLGTAAQSDQPLFQILLVNWPAEGNRTLMSRLHTPDTCWMESGWKGLPDLTDPTTEIEIGTNRVVVQSRVFEISANHPRICVLWAFIINGQPQTETWIQTGDRTYGSLGYAFLRGRMMFQNCLVALRNPRLKDNRVQYIRIHGHFTGDARQTLDRLRQYAKIAFAGHSHHSSDKGGD